LVDTKKSKKSGSQATDSITSFNFVGKVAQMGAGRLYIALPAKKLQETGLQDTLYGKLVKVNVDVVA
jgi:hypothetical protein